MDKYRLIYESIYREKEWFTTTHEFKAENNKKATEYARKFIEKQNKNGGVERFEFKCLEKIIQREKPISIPVTIS